MSWKLARRTTAENWTSGGRGSSTRSSSHTRGLNEIQEEGRRIEIRVLQEKGRKVLVK